MVVVTAVQNELQSCSRGWMSRLVETFDFQAPETDDDVLCVEEESLIADVETRKRAEETVSSRWRGTRFMVMAT